MRKKNIYNRKSIEEFEVNFLSKYATKSVYSKGRIIPEEECPLRTIFQRDRDRIIHSKPFRRLKHKTQVFLSLGVDHFRTRLTHTLEVSQISRTISRALRLNEDLTEAIALGHDLGHTPFGHIGEEVLNKLIDKGFRHNEQSLRVVDIIEKMNLSYEVRDGILNHPGICNPQTLEGKVVQISDRIAYLNHDIDDALRAGILKISDIPLEILKILGEKHSDRISRMVIDVVENSFGKNQITMGPLIHKTMNDLREFMFKKVYLSPLTKKDSNKIFKLLGNLYNYFLENPDMLIKLSQKDISENKIIEHTIDYIAGMTDRYAMQIYQELFLPTGCFIGYYFN